jgi:hypothetical protein
MTADALADARSRPLPWDTASAREFGRQQNATGMPMQSRPVTSATRVMPIAGNSGAMRSSVRAGLTVRSVPAR